MPIPGFDPETLPLRGEITFTNKHVAECRQQVESVGVLCQAAIGDLGVAELTLDGAKRMLETLRICIFFFVSASLFCIPLANPSISRARWKELLCAALVVQQVYFRVGNSSRAFSEVRDYLEMKVRTLLTRRKRRQKRSIGWRRWSNEYIYGILGLYWDWKIYPLKSPEAYK